VRLSWPDLSYGYTPIPIMLQRVVARVAVGTTARTSSLQTKRVGTSRRTLNNKWTRSLATAGTFREERDTFGPINVDSTAYWGAQTQRFVLVSLRRLNFASPSTFLYSQ
jgi:hypothetical protein